MADKEKTHAMSVVLNDADHAAAMQIAEMNGVSFSDWVRKKILQDALLLRIWTLSIPEPELSPDPYDVEPSDDV